MDNTAAEVIVMFSNNVKAYAHIDITILLYTYGIIIMHNYVSIHIIMHCDTILLETYKKR